MDAESENVARWKQFRRFRIRRDVPPGTSLKARAVRGLSTLTYGADAILIGLAIGGIGALSLSMWALGLSLIALLIVGASYWRLATTYPSEGGSYRCASVNLGQGAGRVVAATILVELGAIVALSTAAAAHYITAVFPAIRSQTVLLEIVLLLLVAAVGVAGRRRTNILPAIASVSLVGVVGVLAVAAIIHLLGGKLPHAASSAYHVYPEPHFAASVIGVSAVLLVARAIASGALGLTGLGALRDNRTLTPGRKHAGVKALAMYTLYAGILAILVGLASAMDVRVARHPATQLSILGAENVTLVQDPAISQVSRALFSSAPWLHYLLVAILVAVLLVAAGSTFEAFPRFAAVLAGDGMMPRHFLNRGDRNSFRSGVISIAVGALILLVALGNDLFALVQSLIVVSVLGLSLSQLGMVQHWAGLIRRAEDQKTFRKLHMRRLLALVGTLIAFVIFVLVILDGVAHLWLPLAIVVLVFGWLRAVNIHYQGLDSELQIVDPLQARALPSRTHGIVLISSLHQPTLRAVAFARATRPNTLEAVHVARSDADVAELRRGWDEAQMPLPLTILAAPAAEIAGPITAYISSLRKSAPRDLVVVFIPEYVVRRGWEHALHNNSAARLKRQLLHMPGVVVTAVPWQLGDVERLEVPGTVSVGRRIPPSESLHVTSAEESANDGPPDVESPGETEGVGE